MKLYYIYKASPMSHYSGHYRQRGGGTGALANAPRQIVLPQLLYQQQTYHTSILAKSCSNQVLMKITSDTLKTRT